MKKNKYLNLHFIFSILKILLIFTFPILTFFQDKIGKRGVVCFIFEIFVIYFISYIIKNKKLSYFFNSIFVFLGLINFVVLYFSNTFLNLEMVTNVTNLHGIKGNAIKYILSIIFIIFVSFLPVLKISVNFRKPIYFVCIILCSILVVVTKSYVWSPYYGYAKLAKDGITIKKFYSDIKKEQSMLEDGSLKKQFEKKIVENHFTKPSVLNKNPNVILVFTEGLSENIIFDDRNIMPNVKKFSEECLKFSNYYNHTFATYMGIIGQLFSGYQHNHYDSNNLVSLQSILREKMGYTTHFINAEPNNSEFTSYLENLGFDSVYSNKNIVDDKKNKSLSDKVAYETLYEYTENLSEKEQPFFVCIYTYGTHATFDSPNIQYKDGKNPLLNKFHNSDYWFGKFFEKFKNNSKFENTIFVYTADHATALDNDFINSFPNYDRTTFALDKIPLYFYHKNIEAKSFDVNGRNSLSLVPTILDYLDISDKNYFLGDSLFNENPNNYFDTKFQSYATLYTTFNNEIKVLDDFEFEKKLTQYFAIKNSTEKKNKINATYVNASFDKFTNNCILDISILDIPDSLNIAIWSKKNGQDDLRWFSVPYSESIKIDFSAFNDSGIYLIDIYRIKYGKSYYSTGTTLFID